MSEHKVPSVAAQSIISKLSINENVKPIEVGRRLNVQFGNNVLSRSQICMAVNKVKQSYPVWNGTHKIKLLH